MTIAGMGIAMCSVFVYDSKSTVISILGTYLHGLVLDHFIFGLNPKRRVCIISQKDNDIRTFIVNELHGGATLYEPVGAYNLMPQHEIITIVNKHEYCKLMTYLTQVDPNAFVTVYNVSEVRCRDRCCG